MPPKVISKAPVATKATQNIKKNVVDTKKVSGEAIKSGNTKEENSVKEHIKDNPSESESESSSSSDEDSDTDDNTLVSVEKQFPNTEKVVVASMSKTLPIPASITKTIIFSFKSKDYSFLSNFYCVDLNIDDRLYYHVEGYYQSRKFAATNSKAAEHIRFVPDPMIAKMRGRTGYEMNEEAKKAWDDNTMRRVMNRGVLMKFICNTELTCKLLDTGDAILKEKIKDSYWGIGDDEKGRNEMGKLLMSIREYISMRML